MTFAPGLAAYVLTRDDPLVLDVMGPTIEIVTRAVDDPSAPTLLRGTLPPGAVVPLHAHGDPETFYVLSGRLEGLVCPTDGEAQWLPVGEGEAFHVPPGARHALRNPGEDPNVALVVSTRQMAEFFAAVGDQVADPDSERPQPDPARLQRLAGEAEARGYWNASPQENAAVGITLPPLP